MIRHFFLFFIPLFVCATSFAAYRTEPYQGDWRKLPAEVDKDAFGEAKPRDFFKKRAADNKECVTALKDLRSAYTTAKTEFAGDLKAFREGKLKGDALDTREGAMFTARSKMVEKERDCGNCVVNSLSKKIGPAIFYEVDGTCELEGEGGKELTDDQAKTAFDALHDFLHTPSQYAKRNGGFNNVDDFFAADGKFVVQKDQSKKADDTGKDWFAGIAVRNMGEYTKKTGLHWAFTYFFTAQTEKKDAFTALRFGSSEPLKTVEKGDHPEGQFYRWSAAAVETKALKDDDKNKMPPFPEGGLTLNFGGAFDKVSGIWILNRPTRTVRYRTIGAHQGLPEIFKKQLEKMAARVLSETTHDVKERGETAITIAAKKAKEEKEKNKK